MSDENLTHTCCWCQSAMDPHYAMCGDCWERELKRRETERDHALDDLKAEVANHREDEAKMKALETRVAELEHALKVCHADADRALLSGIRGDYQGALLAIRLTAGNAIA